MASGKRSPRSKSRASATTVVTSAWEETGSMRKFLPEARAASASSSSGSRSRAVTRYPAPARSSATRPVPGADVEHRVAVRRRQRAPQRQVLGVGAALEVVPDHAHRRATAAYRLPEAHRVPAVGQLLTELEQCRVRRQRVQVPRLDRGERLVECRRERGRDAEPIGGHARVLQADGELARRACRRTSPGGPARRASRSRRPTPTRRRVRRPSGR